LANLEQDESAGVLPDVYFGKVESLPDWREDDDEPDDDEADDEPASEDMINILGFDPDDEDYEYQGREIEFERRAPRGY
jgi:hypothetical protein